MAVIFTIEEISTVCGGEWIARPTAATVEGVNDDSRSVVKGKHNYDIYIMDADGGNLTQLTTNSSRDDKPVFAPDGQTVFFRSNRGLVWDIWTMQINSEK